MTAYDLIDSIFLRQSRGPEHCAITRDQLAYLRRLIARDPEGGKIRVGAAGSQVWSPAGRYRYVLTEDLVGEKHTLARLGNVAAGATLFEL